MMINKQNIGAWAERFAQRGLSKTELSQINKELDANPELHSLWKQHLELFSLFENKAQRNAIKNTINAVANTPEEWNNEIATAPKNNTLHFIRRYMVPMAAAVLLVVCSSLATSLIINKRNSKEDKNQYTELVGKINKIEVSLSKLIDSLSKEKNNSNDDDETVNTPEEVALYGGTGFAVNNEGYIATNYHVVRDAKTIYIQTKNGKDKKAYIVASDIKADVALLKIEDKKFRFGKGALPYNIAKSVSGLGQKVFTVGYPKDELVYNEGYVSCDNGFNGDSHSYQLEITANPGQSGSPVLDKKGTVIALITGKQSNTTGTTFAVHSDALINLIQSLPNASNIKLSNTNRLKGIERPEQVKKIRDYVVSVKVN
jgi:S1-C subfamily serine protease